jgi:hypothetical protein
MNPQTASKSECKGAERERDERSEQGKQRGDRDAMSKEGGRPRGRGSLEGEVGKEREESDDGQEALLYMALSQRGSRGGEWQRRPNEK